MSKIEILSQYERWVPELARMHDAVRLNLERLLSGDSAIQGIKFHSLTGRVKTFTSLEQKLSRPDRDYKTISELTDLIAFRIVVYSEDVIEDIGLLIEKSFEVDFNRSTNKLHFTDAEKFGYRSLHYICSLADAPFELKFEVQIRTILQHTWAEIEHDLGYKPTAEFPAGFRRRFSQVASLLEIADREFAAIRKEISTYQQQLQLQTNSLEGADGVGLDQFSLSSVLRRSEISSLDDCLAMILKKPVVEDEFFPDYLLRSLRAAEIRTVGDLLEAAKSMSNEKMMSFVVPYFRFSQRHWSFEKESIREVKRGYGLLFLAHMRVLDRQNLVIDKMRALSHFFQKVDGLEDLDRARAASEALISELNHSVSATP